MSLVSIGGVPLIPVGAPVWGGLAQMPTSLALSNAGTLDAAAEAYICIGHVYTEDGASHTIDTSGSSSIGWLSGTITFANAGTTVKVGLAAVDTANGPPGRAVNVAGTITFDVSKTLTGGGGGITGSAWQTHVPDAGTKTIANGDMVAFALQMTARGGADSVVLRSMSTPFHGPALPSHTDYIGGSFSAGTGIPNVSITFSDGTKGYFIGGFVTTNDPQTVTWNNTSGTKEYGNYLKFAAPVRVYGFCGTFGISGNGDVVVYTDPFGTPASAASRSINVKTTIGGGEYRYCFGLFSTPYDAPANTDLVLAFKPTSATNVTSYYITLPSAADQVAHPMGTNCYAVSRNAGAFSAQNSSKDRFGIGVLVGGFDAGGGGGAGMVPVLTGALAA
jgi:hypothetical protein